MNPSASAFASLFFFCLFLLLLPAQYGASSYAGYKLGSRQIFFKTPERSSSDSQQASAVPPATCSSIATGLGNNKLPIVHRRSPCSPLHGLPSLTIADVLRRDTSLIQRRFASKSSAVASPAPAPSPAATIVPINGSTDATMLPGALDYSVVVGYGTPGQQFPVFLDTSFGTSLVRCKACGPAGPQCDPAFDWTRSTTFAHVPCSSPDCPAVNCSSFACPFQDPKSNLNGRFAKDVLTLAAVADAVVHDFRFVCVNARGPSPLPEVGTLDLSRDRNSLPSRLSSSPWPAIAAFSYCLPRSPSSHGFLSFGAAVGDDDDDDNRTVHAPLLVPNGHPELASMYFVDLIGISLGGEDLPVPAGTFSGGGGSNGRSTTTVLDVSTTFTMLKPAVYTLLRDAFRKDMAEYPPAMPDGFAAGGLDTCYNFTGLHELTVPLVRFKFGNGESLLVDGDQMLYYEDPAAGPFSVACLAFAALDVVSDVFSAVIGSFTLASTEVVYDVAGGKVGFIPWSC